MLMEVYIVYDYSRPMWALCTFGIKVSHSHRRSNREWKPNVKRVKAVVNGTPCHVYACTRCLRSNKVERAI